MTSPGFRRRGSTATSKCGPHESVLSNPARMHYAPPSGREVQSRPDTHEHGRGPQPGAASARGCSARTPPAERYSEMGPSTCKRRPAPEETRSGTRSMRRAPSPPRPRRSATRALGATPPADAPGLLRSRPLPLPARRTHLYSGDGRSQLLRGQVPEFFRKHVHAALLTTMVDTRRTPTPAFAAPK